MFDQKAFDAVDWMVQELHDRGLERRHQLRVLGVALLASELSLKVTVTPGFLFTFLVMLFILWWEERRERVHGAKLVTSQNVAGRTTAWTAYVRLLWIAASISTVLAYPSVLGLANAALFLILLYSLWSIVPHEPPGKRRARKVEVAHELG